MAITLTIENKLKYKIPSKKIVTSAIEEVLEDKKISSDIIVGLKITDTKEIRKLNKTARGIDKPTDVLSFPIFEVAPKKSPNPVLIGDIVICFDIVTENAPKNKHTAPEEFLHLVRHATLHLLGYHHK